MKADVDPYGHAVPEGMRQAAATYAAPIFPDAGFPFADMHMALLDAATGDRDALESRVTALIRTTQAGILAAGPIVPAICHACWAFADADYAGYADILEPLASEVVRVGGSGAQRGLIGDMLLLALMRSGNTAKAAALLDRRLRRRPSPRDQAWRHLLAA